MDILKICAFGLTSAMICVILRRERQEFASAAALAAGFVILALCTDKLISIFGIFRMLTEKSGIPYTHFTNIIKITLIAYICQYTSELCRDCGESAIAVKVELAGKIMILLLTVPLIEAFLNICINIINSV